MLPLKSGIYRILNFVDRLLAYGSAGNGFYKTLVQSIRRSSTSEFKGGYEGKGRTSFSNMHLLSERSGLRQA